MEWISIEERLPDPGFVLAYDVGREHYGVVEYRFGGEWHHISGMHLANVSHWMPLPEPPKLRALITSKRLCRVYWEDGETKYRSATTQDILDWITQRILTGSTEEGGE
jgi:hypothetical protein